MRPPFPAGWSSMPMTLSNLSLANTLPVGQSFLWHRLPLSDAGPFEPAEEFSRAVHDPARVVLLRQTSTRLFYSVVYADEHDAEQDTRLGITKSWLHDYFQLSLNLEDLYVDWRGRDPDLFGKMGFVQRATGVRVLRQDPWECLVAFITSTNNHISRITSLMHKLSQSYSPPLLTIDSTDYYLFPKPSQLPAQLEAPLRVMGFGYRAAFLESSTQTLRAEFGDDVESGLLGWRKLEVDAAREKLMRLKGVGRKVADCVLLMSLDQPSLIPIDTHIAAIAARHPAFPSRLKNKSMSKQIYDETQAFLLNIWGARGGWAQAVMFAADLAPSPKAHKRKASPEKELKRTRSATVSAIDREVSMVRKEVAKIEIQ